MKALLKIFTNFLFLLLLISPVSFAQTQWQILSPGLAYTKINPIIINPWGYIHAFRIDPVHFNFQLALAKDYKLTSANVRQLAEKADALLAVNGGFFTPEWRPVGLRIINNTIRSPLKKSNWLGVFYLVRDIPHIVSERYFHHQRGINFAIQGGPRLIINGEIPPLKPGLAERTAIGITPTNNIILLITQNTPMTTTQLAEIMLKPEIEDGLACLHALNLDGGHSTQLYAKIDDFSLDIPGFSSIIDAVYVKKK